MFYDLVPLGLGTSCQGLSVPSACLSCSSEYHEPCSCMDRNHFTNHTSQYKLTKICPKGHELVKNSASNHIMCKSCRRDYCFICVSDLGRHKGCVHYTGPEDGRLAHYMERYQAHHTSQIMSEKVLEFGLAHVVRIGVNTLIAARQLLKYSFVYAYLHRVNSSFEEAQWKLEKTVEDLNRAIEDEYHDFTRIEDLTQDVAILYEAMSRKIPPKLQQM